MKPFICGMYSEIMESVVKKVKISDDLLKIVDTRFLNMRGFVTMTEFVNYCLHFYIDSGHYSVVAKYKKVDSGKLFTFRINPILLTIIDRMLSNKEFYNLTELVNQSINYYISVEGRIMTNFSPLDLK